MSINNSSLGSKGIDAIQSLKKSYDPTKEAHKVLEINEPFNKTVYTYTACRNISTITYTHDCTAEVSKVVTTADTACSLSGKFFSVFSANNTKEHRPFFRVCCAPALPCDTACINYIAVNIVACDASCVTALALKQALDGDCCASCDFTITRIDNAVTITNNVKGTATDINDSGCTCFTLTVVTQGTQATTETLTYTYDACNRLCAITNSSG